MGGYSCPYGFYGPYYSTANPHCTLYNIGAPVDAVVGAGNARSTTLEIEGPTDRDWGGWEERTLALGSLSLVCMSIDIGPADIGTPNIRPFFLMQQ